MNSNKTALESINNFRRHKILGGAINFPDRPSKIPLHWYDGISHEEKIEGLNIYFQIIERV